MNPLLKNRTINVTALETNGALQKDYKALVRVNLVNCDKIIKTIIFNKNVSDAPVYVSFPHFLDADPSLLAPFEGLNPSKEKHETIFKVQPVS